MMNPREGRFIYTLRPSQTKSLLSHRHLNTEHTNETEARAKMRRPGILSGLFVAAMVTAALIGILFFGWRVAGLPFVPFDTFDWLTRVLPGRLIALGIGAMVTVIRMLNLGPTSAAAKTAEQAIAISGLLAAGIAGGLILFLILRSISRGRGVTTGLALGIALGIPAMLISLHASGTASAGPATGAVWVLGAFLIWGAVLGRAEQRLIDIEKTTDAAVERVDRRRFLIKLGGTTAAITVAGAVVGELA